MIWIPPKKRILTPAEMRRLAQIEHRKITRAARQRPGGPRFTFHGSLDQIAFRWRDELGRGRDDNRLVLMVFILALSVGNHLMAFLAAPAATVVWTAFSAPAELI